MAEERTFLFTYGSLKQDGEAHALLKDAKFIGNIAMPGLSRVSDLPDTTDSGYPAAVVDGLGEVHGELYDIPVAILPLLDEYEGENYMRIQRDNIHVYVLKDKEWGKAVGCGESDI